MAKGKNGAKYDSVLASWIRWAMVVAAAVLVGLAVWIAVCPGVTRTVEIAEASIGKTVEATKDWMPLILFLGAAALFLLFWAVNGFRLTRFSIGPLSASGISSVVQKADQYSKSGQELVSVELPPQTEEGSDGDTEPKRAPEGAVLISQEPEAVYSLESLPIKVITDLFTNWPEGHSKPGDLSGFEFATRTKGKGNHPWVIKFEGVPAIKLSYGGRGKTGPSVSQNT